MGTDEMEATVRFGWDDLDLVADIVREIPQVDPRGLNDAELRELVEAIDGFDPDRGSAGPADLEIVRAKSHWGA